MLRLHLLPISCVLDSSARWLNTPSPNPNTLINVLATLYREHTDGSPSLLIRNLVLNLAGGGGAAVSNPSPSTSTSTPGRKFVGRLPGQPHASPSKTTTPARTQLAIVASTNKPKSSTPQAGPSIPRPRRIAAAYSRPPSETSSIEYINDNVEDLRHQEAAIPASKGKQRALPKRAHVEDLDNEDAAVEDADIEEALEVPTPKARGLKRTKRV